MNLQFLPPAFSVLKIMPTNEVPFDEVHRLCLKCWDGTTPELVLRKLESGALEAYSTGEGLVLIETVDWPKGRELWLYGVVGRGILRNVEAIIADLKLLAAYKGCSMIGANGIPKGWKRVSQRVGFNPVSTHYVLEL